MTSYCCVYFTDQKSEILDFIMEEKGTVYSTAECQRIKVNINNTETGNLTPNIGILVLFFTSLFFI